jgi:hypothetical protein
MIEGSGSGSIPLEDPDPGGPNTYGSDGSGSATLVARPEVGPVAEPAAELILPGNLHVQGVLPLLSRQQKNHKILEQ